MKYFETVTITFTKISLFPYGGGWDCTTSHTTGGKHARITFVVINVTFLAENGQMAEKNMKKNLFNKVMACLHYQHLTI